MDKLLQKSIKRLETIEEFVFDKNWWSEKYASKLDARFITFKTALNIFLQRNGKLILETGCLRLPDDYGAGQSTLIFADFCSRYKKKLISVDNDAEHLNTAKEVVKPFSNSVEFFLEDSLTFFRNYQGEKIDLLYLDSLDANPNSEEETKKAQIHQLRESQLAFPHLSNKAIVLLDDNQLPYGGKTYLSKRFFLSKGFTLLIDSQQVLLSK